MLDTSECEDYLEEIQSAAKACKLDEKFDDALDELEAYGCSAEGDLTEMKVIMLRDPRVMSFGLKLERRDNSGRYVFVSLGALLYDPEKLDWEIRFGA